ncbi:tetratricopeptide repeat protein [Nitrospira sp. Kam-Ns4a]
MSDGRWWRLGAAVTALLIGLLLSPWPADRAAVQANGPADDDPPSLQRKLARLLESGARESSDPHVLLTLADLYLDLGDNAYTDPAQRMAAYEEGARFAKRALERDEANGIGHYLYAANAGSAAELKGVMASALLVRDLKAHVDRALALKPDYAPALHMMGRLLEELPWILGGDEAAGLDYLERAVALDPTYAHARLDLAKSYLRHNQVEAARRELRAIVHLRGAGAGYAWRTRYRPEAERLLASLDSAAP